MSNIGIAKGILEVGKFAVYVTVPIGLMYFFAGDPKNINKIMGGRQYVVYPPDSLRPLTPEERRELGLDLGTKGDTF